MQTLTQKNYSWAQIVARAWSDDSFKQRLLKDPANVLNENGFRVESDTRVFIMEGFNQPLQADGKTLRLNLPAKPTPEEVFQEELSARSSLAETSGSSGCSLCRTYSGFADSDIEESC